jgi:hypothetical protein
VVDAIYTHDEIRKLRGMPKEALEVNHQAKELFPGSIIRETKVEPDGN